MGVGWVFSVYLMLYDDAPDVEHVHVVDVLEVRSEVDFAEMPRDVERSISWAEMGRAHEHNGV